MRRYNSLINNKNNIGSSTVPCSTPTSSGMHSDITLLNHEVPTIITGSTSSTASTPVNLKDFLLTDVPDKDNFMDTQTKMKNKTWKIRWTLT